MGTATLIKPRTDEYNLVGSLLSSTARVDAPFIKVRIGEFEFGVYKKSNGRVEYPNYVQSLEITKINGTVNQYTFSLIYPITFGADPNFFEKVFGTIQNTRLIYFEYGDAMQPNYIYREEEAIITDVQNSFDINGSTITYTVKAVGTSQLTLSAVYSFPTFTGKPSEKIMEIFLNDKYHLREVYKGMPNSKEKLKAFIPMDDTKVTVPAQTNIGALEYLAVLVSYMIPQGTSNKDVLVKSVYTLTTFEDINNKYGGAYFKVEHISASSQASDLTTYTIDIGYPEANVISSFSIDSNTNWALLYNYATSDIAVPGSDIVKRVNDKGAVESISYNPRLPGTTYNLKPSDRTWWTKATQYPVKATIEIKGLLRPAILMQYVRLNVWLGGHKHISSGYYIITSQKDKVGIDQPYSTTLTLLRVSSDDNLA